MKAMIAVTIWKRSHCVDPSRDKIERNQLDALKLHAKLSYVPWENDWEFGKIF